ncbi:MULTISPECIES: hypothetical protein [unclassified Blastococcus]
MSTFSATTTLTRADLAQATAVLQGELRRQSLAADVHEVLFWQTFEVVGPVELVDAEGGRHFRYEGTVTGAPPRGRGSVLARIPSVWRRV